MKKNKSKFGILILVSLLLFGLAFCFYKFVYKNFKNDLLYLARVSDVKFVQDGETYKFSYTSPKQLNLSTDKNYEVYIKNKKCTTNYYSDNKLNCSLLIDDKDLTINFENTEDKTSVSFETSNSDYWENYLSKFIIRVKATSQSEEMKTVTLVTGDNTEILKVRTGYTIELPATIEIDDTFLGWEYDGQIITNLTVTKDAIIRAKTTTMYTVFIYRNAPDKVDENSDRIGSRDFASGSKILLDEPTCDNFKFLGWSLDKKTLIDLDTYKITSNITIYAMWDTTKNSIKIEFNEPNASIDFNGKTITGNQTVYVDFTDKITITNPTLKDYALAYVEIVGSFEKETYTANELEEIGTYEFYYKNLNSNSEYDPDGSTTADKTITIKLVFVSTVDEILTMENKIYKSFGVKSEEITEREDEQTFLKTLYFGLSRDEKIYTVAEYRQKLAEMFSFEYNENCTFEEYLKTFIEKALFEYKVKIIINNEATTKTVVGKNTISIETPIKQGYFTFWKIEGMTSSHKKYYAIGSTDNFIEIPAEQTSIEFEAEDWIFLKDLSEEGGEIVLTATFTVRQYYIEYDLDGGLGDTTQTIMDYDKTFTLSAPVKTGYIFTGWTITNMDHCEHIFGDKTTTDATINLTTATEFKNLNSTSGKIKFTANWKVDPNYRGGR